VLQRFGFTYSSPQSTPLPTSHSLSAPPSDESVEPTRPYPELVGCLIYLMTCTRPDLAYPLSLLARYVAPGRHRKVHWDAPKRVLRYLCSTLGMGLVLGGRARVVLTGHADASRVDDLATQRSSSCEAEIYAGAMAAQELRRLTYLLTDLGEAPRSPPVLYVDNKAMLALCQEHTLEHRTKHIALRYFLPRELKQRGQLRLAYVASQANTADVFTKALQPCDHQPCFAFLDWSCDLLFSPPLPMGMDISTAFLNGILEEDVNMKQPPGYEDGTGRVCKLKKSIYGLKQAPCCWYQKLAAVLEEMGFRTSSCDDSLFLKGEGEKLVLFLVYVDDILLFSSSMKGIQCKTFGEVKSYLKMHVERDFNEIFALTAQPPTLRVLLADAIVSGEYIIQMDISREILNRNLQEEVHMMQPSGYEDGTGRVCKLNKSLPPLPPLPAPPCLPCVEGRQRTALHSSFPTTTAPLQTLHMDVWGPARDLPVLRLLSDRGGEFSSDLLQDFCQGEEILQLFLLPASPQQNGIAERRIGLVMEVARTSMIHAVAAHFLWPFAVWYAAHQLNLWRRVSLPETSPTLHWTGEVGDASVFRV
ncbi:unnamed protein product, partial [Closterium sp. NIES-53]